jgi:hypothetical protein
MKFVYNMYTLLELLRSIHFAGRRRLCWGPVGLIQGFQMCLRRVGCAPLYRTVRVALGHDVFGLDSRVLLLLPHACV